MSRRSTTSQVLRRIAVVLAATVSLGTLSLVTGLSPAHASSDESAFVADINHSRAQHGLRPLSVSSNLTSVARRWSQHMASGGCGGGQSICHNPNLTSQVSGWQKIGENVGVGPDEGSIENAFMNSSHHRANILDPDFTLVGVGTVRGSDGRLYVTQDFERPSGASSSSSSSKQKSSSTRSSAPSTSRSRTSRPATTRSGSTAPVRPKVRPAPAARPASPLVARLRTLTARPATGADPVGQALAFHSAMGYLTR